MLKWSDVDQTVLKQYLAAREAVGFRKLSERGKLRVTGPDRIGFLQAIISNEVSALPEWHGRYGTLLTARGRIVSDFCYYRLPESVLLDIDSHFLPKTLQVLEGYVIMDDVLLKDVSEEWSHWSLQGPKTEDLLREVFPSFAPGEAWQVQEVHWQGMALLLINKNERAPSQVEMLLPREAGALLEKEIRKESVSKSLQDVGDEAWEILRLEAGIPLFGVDMDEQRYPMEARLSRAVSLTKGCFVGQEVVAKATNVGGVNNLLMGLRLDGASVPARGSAVLSGEGKQVGMITSAVFSPRNRCPIALAYLKTKFAISGSECMVVAENDRKIRGHVVDDLASL